MNETKEAPAPQLDAIPHPHVAPAMPVLVSGQQVDVHTDDDQLCFSGQIEMLSTDILRVSMVRGEFLPSTQPDTPLKISGTLPDGTTFLLHGKVVGSRKTYWLIDCLTVLQVRSHRAYYRQKVLSDARFAVIGDLYNTQFGDSDPELIFSPCEILNVSLGGIGMSSKVTLHEGTRLFFKGLQLHEKRKPMSLSCRVVRAWEEDGELQYGCQMEPLSVQDRSHLLQALLLLNTDERQHQHQAEAAQQQEAETNQQVEPEAAQQPS